jgi:hypothetical protein
MGNAIDFAKLAEQAVATGADHTVKTAGPSGDYKPPAEGPCRLRLVSYIELGKQKGSYMGVPRVKEEVVLTFELSGPNHAPADTDNGPMPTRMDVKIPKSLNEKSAFSILFHRMNYKGTAKHFAQLLGQPFKGRVFHRKAKDGVKVFADLKSKDTGYAIEAPRFEVTGEDGPTGEWRELVVAPAITPIKLFLWDLADMDQWNSIFIDGTYEEKKDATGKVTMAARSKNKFQNLIKSAANFQGSPIHTLLVNSGQPLDLPAPGDMGDDEEEEVQAAPAAAPAVPQGAAADDALNGVV